MFDLYANALYNLSVIEVFLRVILVVCLIVLVIKEIRKPDKRITEEDWDYEEWEHVYGQDE